MTSKKAPSGRCATPPRAFDRTKAFVKDWTRLSHSGRYDMKRLKEVMLLLVARDERLHSRPTQAAAQRLAGGDVLRPTRGGELSGARRA